MSYERRIAELSPQRVLSFGRLQGGRLVSRSFNSSTTSPTVQNWPSANRALYYPMYSPVAVVAAKLFWINGSSATGNADAGIYDAYKNKIVSTGSIARSGTSVCQYVNITDTMIPAGRFWLALACDTTGSFGVVDDDGSTYGPELEGMFQEDSAFPLPASMTPVAVTVTGGNNLHFPVGFNQDGSF